MSDAVFGPDRQDAARRAFGALREARARLATSHPYSGVYDVLLSRVRECEVVRAQYGEYGDSMFGGVYPWPPEPVECCASGRCEVCTPGYVWGVSS
jgi:hypothetical protein